MKRTCDDCGTKMELSTMYVNCLVWKCPECGKQIPIHSCGNC